LNSLASLVLAAAFYYFFMFTKHDPSLAAIIAFGEDPYDAIGSFCVILSIPLTVLSLLRALRPYRRNKATALTRVYLARTQIALALGVIVTLAADSIAMVRHVNEWAGKNSVGELAALSIVMAALAIGAVLLVVREVRTIDLPVAPGLWNRALIVMVAFVLILALFPEKMIGSASLHFLAIVLSFVLIAAPQTALAMALIPFDTTQKNPGSGQARSRTWIQWGGVALLGFAFGLSALMAELFGEGGGSLPFVQLLIVSSMYLGAGTSALLIAFAFYKKPLGLFVRTSQS
jgi:hypothetical protein